MGRRKKPELPTKRIDALKNSLYYRHKIGVSGHKPGEMAEHIAEMDSSARKQFKTEAQAIGTLPSVLCAEFFKDKPLSNSNTKNALSQLNVLLTEDEQKAAIYAALHEITGRTTIREHKAQMTKKLGISRNTYQTRLNELKKDFDLGLTVKQKYAGLANELGSNPGTQSTPKVNLFKRMDQAHDSVGLYYENGKPKPLVTLDKELKKKGVSNIKNLYTTRKSAKNWRRWEDAVEEWQISRLAHDIKKLAQA
ncbi:hypothetical protein ACFLQ2_05260 [archaeon]